MISLQAVCVVQALHVKTLPYIWPRVADKKKFGAGKGVWFGELQYTDTPIGWMILGRHQTTQRGYWFLHPLIHGHIYLVMKTHLHLSSTSLIGLAHSPLPLCGCSRKWKLRGISGADCPSFAKIKWDTFTAYRFNVWPAELTLKTSSFDNSLTLNFIFLGWDLFFCIFKHNCCKQTSINSIRKPYKPRFRYCRLVSVLWQQVHILDHRLCFWGNCQNERNSWGPN